MESINQRMSTTLERRTAKLEQAAHSDEDRLNLITVRGMSTSGSKTVRAAFGDIAQQIWQKC